MTTSLERGEKAGPACVLADRAGPVAGFGGRGALAGQELLDGFDGREVLRLPLVRDECVGAVVGSARIDAPYLVQLVALTGRHAPQPVNPDLASFLLHAEQHTKVDAETDAMSCARLMPNAMLMNMTNEMPHTAKCLNCGRVRHFRSAAAAERAKPAGRVCAMRIRLAAMTEAVKGFAAAQVEKAREAIADGAFVPTGHHGVFAAVSSNGVDRYLTHSAACNCPAGLRGRQCYHLAAARILTVTGKA